MGSASFCISQRRPYWTVSFAFGCHLSWAKNASSVWGMSWVPASSEVSPLTPNCWRNSSSGPVMLAPDGHAPVSEVEPSEHSTYFGLRA